MSVPGYASYRDSGLEWVELVPQSWSVAPLKSLAGFINGDAFKPTEWSESGIPIIRIQNLNGGGDFNFFEGTVEQRYHVKQGDLLFGWSGNRGTSFGPFVWRKSGLFYLNQHIFRVVSEGVDRGWLYWCLKSVTVYVEQEAHGIIGMVHVTKGRLGSISVPVPSFAEQRAIAAFLDRETGKIDALVEAQRGLIGLLKEKRQAVISHAVTRGLHPAASMKDSGVEWLGEVPAHWDVVPLKRNLVFLTSGSRGWAEHYADDGALFLRIGNLTRDRVDLDLADTQRVAVPPGSEGERTRVQSGDVLFSITAFLGSVAVVPPELETAFVSQHVALARLAGGRLLPKWVAYVTLSRVGKTQLEMGGYGGTKIQLSLGDVGDLLMTVPPPSEQATILNWLDAKLKEFSALESEAEKAISLLQERRAALISAAITGKIDVRGIAPNQAEAA